MEEGKREGERRTAVWVMDPMLNERRKCVRQLCYRHDVLILTSDVIEGGIRDAGHMECESKMTREEGEKRGKEMTGGKEDRSADLFLEEAFRFALQFIQIFVVEAFVRIGCLSLASLLL